MYFVDPAFVSNLPIQVNLVVFYRTRSNFDTQFSQSILTLLSQTPFSHSFPLCKGQDSPRPQLGEKPFQHLYHLRHYHNYHVMTAPIYFTPLGAKQRYWVSVRSSNVLNTVGFTPYYVVINYSCQFRSCLACNNDIRIWQYHTQQSPTHACINNYQHLYRIYRSMRLPPTMIFHWIDLFWHINYYDTYMLNFIASRWSCVAPAQRSPLFGHRLSDTLHRPFGTCSIIW